MVLIREQNRPLGDATDLSFPRPVAGVLAQGGRASWGLLGRVPRWRVVHVQRVCSLVRLGELTRVAGNGSRRESYRGGGWGVSPVEADTLLWLRPSLVNSRAVE